MKHLFTIPVNLQKVLDVFSNWKQRQQPKPADHAPDDYRETHNRYWFQDAEAADYDKRDLFLID